MLECNLHSCDKQRNLDREYGEFILELSRCSYEPLLWYLTLKKERDMTLDWNLLYGNGHYADIHSDNSLSLEGKRTAILNRFRTRGETETKQYARTYPELVAVMESLKSTLHNAIGLTADNAYLYVRGHNLYDFLTHNFFEPVQNYLRGKHEAEITTHTTGSDTGNAIRHYHKMIKNFCNHHILRTDFINDSGNPITQRIEQDLGAINNGGR